MGSRKKEVPEDLKRMRVELDKWRSRRRHGQRIPEDLWGAAVRVVPEYGLN
jgi:hypothetical protein